MLRKGDTDGKNPKEEMRANIFQDAFFFLNIISHTFSRLIRWGGYGCGLRESVCEWEVCEQYMYGKGYIKGGEDIRWKGKRRNVSIERATLRKRSLKPADISHHILLSRSLVLYPDNELLQYILFLDPVMCMLWNMKRVETFALIYRKVL